MQPWYAEVPSDNLLVKGGGGANARATIAYLILVARHGLVKATLHGKIFFQCEGYRFGAVAEDKPEARKPLDRQLRIQSTHTSKTAPTLLLL